MSKFKSFASQGSFGDYRIVVPDESQKILEQKREVVRGKERAEQFRKENSDIYLRAQQLAQGLEQQNREQNFKLETENRQAFKDQLNEEYKLQVQADQQRLDAQQKTLQNISAFSQTALKLGFDINNQITKNQTSANAAMVYKTGADYKTLVAIQALGDNITKAEFAQLDFIRARVEKGGNIDGFWDLFQRRKTRGFIDNIATVQNTAYGYGEAKGIHMSEWAEKNPSATLDQQAVEEAAFRDNFVANNFTVNGRSINPELLNSYAFPIIRNYETQSMAERDRQRTKEREEIRFDAQSKAFSAAFGADRNFTALLKEVTTNPSAGKFKDFARWAVNRSKDMGPTGLSYQELDTLLDTIYEGPNFKDTGKHSTLRADREGRPEVLLLMEARDERRKKELNDYNLGIKEEEMDMDIKLNTMYEKFAADGVLDDDEFASMKAEADTLPTYNSKVLEAANQQRDSVRTSSAYLKLAQDSYAAGKTVFDANTVQGLSFKDKEAILELRRQQIRDQDSPVYKTDIEAIKAALSQDPRIKAAPVTGKENYSVLLMQDRYTQLYKQTLARTKDHNEARSITLAQIQTLLANPKSINSQGQYSAIVQQESQFAGQGKRTLESYREFVNVIADPKIRNNPTKLANTLGAAYVYNAYDDMKAGKPASAFTKNAASLMDMTPLDFVNYLASGAKNPNMKPITLDKQVEQIRQGMKPIATRLFNAPYRTNDRIIRGTIINSDGLPGAPRRTSFGPSQSSNLTDPVLRRAADITSNYESAGSGGYNAVNQGGSADGTSIPAGFYSGDFRGMSQHKGRALTDLTVGEIMSLQSDPGKGKMSDDEWVKRGKLHAVGRYQFIGPTLRGLVQRLNIPLNAKFSPELQDRLFLSLLKSGGPGQWVGLRNATIQELAIIRQAQSKL